MPSNAWSEQIAGGLDDLDQLVYRSNLLGSDELGINFGGGNTSVKTRSRDHLQREVEVLWIKGTGSDLATIEAKDFTPLNVEDVAAAQTRETMSDDEMVEYLGRCSLDPQAPRASIETILHAFLPFKHVDHTHARAALAFCCSGKGEELTRACFGDEIVWVPYVRPGFALAKLALESLSNQPAATGMMLAKHGLVTWGNSGQESYSRTISALSKAESFLEGNVDTERPFGEELLAPASEEIRRRVMLELLPPLRGELSRMMGAHRRVILHWDSSDEIMQFVSAREMPVLASTGAACPDHVMYTKFLPLTIDAGECRTAAEGGSTDTLIESVRRSVQAYSESYREFFQAYQTPEVEMLDPAPRVILIPGFGMVTAGGDDWVAENTASLYRTAVTVMRWCRANGGYTSLTPREAWDIEYWPLELYKLTQRPGAKELAGHVAIITGGAGAIGRAAAIRLAAEDAHVVIADLDTAKGTEFVDSFPKEQRLRVRFVEANAASEADTDRTLEEAILAFGGVDIVVPNAGRASAGPIEETEVEEWDQVHAVLLRGYFLACRAAFRVMKPQGCGGSDCHQQQQERAGGGHQCHRLHDRQSGRAAHGPVSGGRGRPIWHQGQLHSARRSHPWLGALGPGVARGARSGLRVRGRPDRGVLPQAKCVEGTRYR